MHKKNFLISLPLLFMFGSAFSQIQPTAMKYKLAGVEINTDSCFHKTLSYLQNHDWFIEAVDKESGFIRAKTYKKNNNAFTQKAGERRTLSIFLKPAANGTLLSLNIYSEVVSRGGNTNTLVYYTEDKGVINDEPVYRALITDLQKELK